jgi:hypothetical protein
LFIPDGKWYTINPTSIGYGFLWGLWEGLGWLDKKLDQIKHAMQHNMDEQNDKT